MYNIRYKYNMYYKCLYIHIYYIYTREYMYVRIY